VLPVLHAVVTYRHCFVNLLHSCQHFHHLIYAPCYSAPRQVLLHVQDHVPHVQVAASAFGAISRAAERQTGTVPLQLGISVTPTNQVTALVQELDPLGETAALQGVVSVGTDMVAYHELVVRYN
jgi:hypothetical protein